MTKAAGGRANHTKKEPTTKTGEGDNNDEPTSIEDSIEDYIPPYLIKFINPYYGDFCYTRCFHYMLVAQVMSEGFLPIEVPVGCQFTSARIESLLHMPDLGTANSSSSVSSSKGGSLGAGASAVGMGNKVCKCCC